MDKLKNATYLYSGTNLSNNNANYKQINLNNLNHCLCFYAHEDSEIWISKLDGSTFYSSYATYHYIYESDIIKCNNQGFDNQYVNNYNNSNGYPISRNIGVSSSGLITIKISCGDRVYIWQDKTFNSSNYNKLNIRGSGKYSVSGNILSLYSQNLTVSACPVFTSLFENNEALYDASGLILYGDNLTLPSDCYYKMFEGCSQLRYPPKLPDNVTVNDYSFSHMFKNCVNLIVAPDIPLNVTLASSGVEEVFSSMFYGCTSLMQAPELPSFNYLAGSWIFTSMFEGCTNLIAGPSEIKYSGAYACQEMFRDCTSLIKPPKLPNLELTNDCYYRMFYNCTSLEEAPELPALELNDNCYGGMFNGCSNLKYIKADFLTNIFDADENIATTGWVNGVSSEGIFYKNADGYFNGTGTSGIPTGWIVRTEFPITDGLILWLDGHNIHSSSSSSTGSNDWSASICVPALITQNWKVRPSAYATTLCNGKCIEVTGKNGGMHAQTASTSKIGDNPFFNIEMTENSSMTYEMFLKLDKNQTESSTPTSSLRIGGMTYASTSSGAGNYRWIWNIDAYGRPYIYTPYTGSTWYDILHGTKNIADGNYHHVVFQKDETTLKLYIDGKLDKKEINSTWKLNVNTGCFIVGIGRYDGLQTTAAASVRSHPGKYYSLSIYNRALSDKEIKLNYQILKDRYDDGGFISSTGTTSNPQFYHNFYNYFYFENLGDNNNYIKITRVGSATDYNEPELEYSFDKLSWNELELNTNRNFGSRKKIYIRGTNSYMGKSTSDYVYFSSGQNVNVGGNILSLICDTADTFKSTLSYIFVNLFRNMNTLISAEKLHIPPPINGYCYYQTFYGCSNLIKPPKILTNFSAQSYGWALMFYACGSLKYAPTLWNRSVASNCYKSMFYNCSSLKYLKAMLTTQPSSSYTATWLYGVSSTGTFIKNSDANWSYTPSTTTIPSGWTVVTSSY